MSLRASFCSFGVQIQGWQRPNRIRSGATCLSFEPKGSPGHELLSDLMQSIASDSVFLLFNARLICHWGGSLMLPLFGQPAGFPFGLGLLLNCASVYSTRPNNTNVMHMEVFIFVGVC